MRRLHHGFGIAALLALMIGPAWARPRQVPEAGAAPTINPADEPPSMAPAPPVEPPPPPVPVKTARPNPRKKDTPRPTRPADPEPTPPPPEPLSLDADARPAPLPATDAGVLRTAGDQAQAGNASGFVLPADAVKLGRQAVALSVEVQAPAIINLNRDATLKIVVRNTGGSDAHHVVVRDALPDGLKFLGSTPETQEAPTLVWVFPNIPANSEQVIQVRVRPKVVQTFEHAATVAMLAGGKSRTLVQQPLLKVEVEAVPKGEVLKGKPVRFNISVSNPGTGPVRDVTVDAKLGPGLRNAGGNVFNTSVASIEPGESIKLEPLVVDTVQGGEWACAVTARSPDVFTAKEGDAAPAPGDAYGTAAVKVVEPKLALTLTGQAKRYTDTTADYTLKVKNTGTAPLRNAKAEVVMAEGTKLEQVSASSEDYKYVGANRRLAWTPPATIDPGGEATLTFRVRLGGVGIYNFTAAAAATLAPKVGTSTATDVEGIAWVDLDVKAKPEILDVGDESTFVIRLHNKGTKDAAKVLVNAVLTDNLEVMDTDGHDGEAQKAGNANGVIFPVVDRLPPTVDGTTLLTIRVRATKPGRGSCNVYLTHDDNPDKISDHADVRVMGDATAGASRAGGGPK